MSILRCLTTGFIHILSTPTTWIDHGWTSLKDTVFNAEPLLGRIEEAWHKPQCERPEATFTIDKLGRWIYLEFRPLCRLSTIEQNAEFFPPIKHPLSVSLQGESIQIAGFVCSDISEWPNAHYWLVEVINGQIQGIYDSLKGPQHLTIDVGKKLKVTGLLLCKTSIATPKMCSVLLDEAAGKIPSTMKQTRPIKVHCRQKVLTSRNFLKHDCDKPTDKRKASSKSKLNIGGPGKKLPNTRSTVARKLCPEVNRMRLELPCENHFPVRRLKLGQLTGLRIILLPQVLIHLPFEYPHLPWTGRCRSRSHWQCIQRQRCTGC